MVKYRDQPTILWWVKITTPDHPSESPILRVELYPPVDPYPFDSQINENVIASIRLATVGVPHLRVSTNVGTAK